MSVEKFYRRNECKANIKMKQESINTIDPTIFSKDYVFSDGFIITSKKYKKESVKTNKELSKLVKKLVSIRNKMLTSFLRFQRIEEEVGYYNKIEKTDIINILEFVSKMSQTKYVKPHFLYDLKVRDPNSDIYEDDYLSE